MIKYALKNKSTNEYVTFWTTSTCYDSDIEMNIDYLDDDVWLLSSLNRCSKSLMVTG